MNIGGLPINLNFSGIGRTLLGGMYVIGILLICGVIGWFVWRYYQTKGIYNVPVKLVKCLENGTKKELSGLFGGKIVNRGVATFQIKIPKQRKPFDLGYMPDFSLADADGKLSFITSGDSTLWQQLREELVTEEIIEIKDGEQIKRIKYTLLMKPIPTEIKTKTINDMMNWRAILDKNKLTAWTITIIGFIIMVIAHLISLYVQTKIKCPTP